MESGRGVGRSRGCEGCKGCFSKGCEWLGLGNRLWRFPKGFWGMVGYGREIGWGTRRVAGNRSVRGGGGGVWRPGGLRPPRQPNQSKGRAALRAAGPCFVRASRARRPPAWPQRPPCRPLVGSGAGIFSLAKRIGGVLQTKWNIPYNLYIFIITKYKFMRCPWNTCFLGTKGRKYTK